MKGDTSGSQAQKVADPRAAWIQWLKALALGAVVAGGVFGGVSLTYLVPVVVILAIVWGLDDWRAALKAVDVEPDDEDPKPPWRWILVTLIYVAATAAVVAVAWRYLP
jgi:hypothetical protein